MEMVAKMLTDLNLEEDKALLGSLEKLKEFFQSNYMNSSLIRRKGGVYELYFHYRDRKLYS